MKIIMKKVNFKEKIMKKFKYVFIVTYGRSGSTLLQNILNSIDGYLIRGENNNILFDLYKSYRKAIFAKERFGMQYLDEKTPWFGSDLIGPEKFGRKLVHLFTNEILNPEIDTKVLGFKEIRYFENQEEFKPFLKFMLRMYSPACIIFNKRDANEVKKSGWWKDMPEEQVIETINSYDKIMEEFIKENPENSIMVDYNKYTKDYHELSPLFEFLNEDLNENNLKDILNIKLTH